MDINEIAVRLAVMDLLARYTHAGDDHDARAFGELFGTDGVLEVVGGARGRGAAEVSRLMQDFLDLLVSTPGFVPFRHHLTATKIDVLGADEARASSYFSVFCGTGVDQWGIYNDHLHRVDGHWQFAHRTVTVEGSAAGSPSAPLVGAAR